MDDKQRIANLEYDLETAGIRLAAALTTVGTLVEVMFKSEQTYQLIMEGEIDLAEHGISFKETDSETIQVYYHGPSDEMIDKVRQKWKGVH